MTTARKIYKTLLEKDEITAEDLAMMNMAADIVLRAKDVQKEIDKGAGYAWLVCSNCGGFINKNDKFCSKCGYEFEGSDEYPSIEDKRKAFFAIMGMIAEKLELGVSFKEIDNE